MLKSLYNSDTAKEALGWLTARYIRLVHDSARRIISPPDMEERIRDLAPAIFAGWHGQFLLSPLVKPDGVPAKIMIARHGDAEIIARAMRHFDIGLIRGAGAGRRRRDRGGASAFRAALKALQSGESVAMTADVPPGPARRAGAGIVSLASLSGRPIIPMGFATRRYTAFRTWSRFTLNLPFSTLAMVMGEPIHVPKGADDETLETYRRDVQSSLNAATRRAYELAGADPSRAAPVNAANPEDPRLMLKTYRLLTWAARPAAGYLLAQRVKKGKEVSERLGERTGVPSRSRPAGPLWWFHAASVGETNAILPLLHALRERYPHLNLLLTTFTVTSARVASTRLPEGAIHQFVPLDSPVFVRRFLDYWRPDLAVFTESEIWPNLILDTHARGAPLILVNARMSQRSFQRWRKRPSMSRPLFSRFSLVLAQDERLARRFEQSGAHSVETVGNLKIDSPAPPVDVALLARLRTAVAARPVFLAASTHAGEDEAVADAARLLREPFPDLLTVIVPRHPERGPEIVATLAPKGLNVTRRSSGVMPGPDTTIYVADTIGELGTWYELSQLAFIGGSLVAHGGQNPIEAIKLNTGVISGPHWYNFAESFEALIQGDGCMIVQNATELADTVALLLRDEQRLAAMRERASTIITELGGALARTLAALAAYAPEESQAPAETSVRPAQEREAPQSPSARHAS